MKGNIKTMFHLVRTFKNFNQGPKFEVLFIYLLGSSILQEWIGSNITSETNIRNDIGCKKIVDGIGIGIKRRA